MRPSLRFRLARRLLAALVGTALAASCSGLGSASPQSKPALPASRYVAEKGVKGGQLVYADWQEVDDLNLFTSADPTAQATNVIWAWLWTFDAENIPVPDLVTAVPTTQNGLVRQLDSTHMDVTINLKKGLKWSDGSDLTANDVKYTVNAICDADTGAPTTRGWDHIVSQEVKSREQLIWHFGPNKAGNCGLDADLPSGVYSPYLLLTLQPLPMARLSTVKHADFATDKYFTQKPDVTSGPYLVQNFTPGANAQVVMVPNPHYVDGRAGSKYFGHAPYLDKLTYKVYGDKAAELAGLKSGEADLGLGVIAKDMPTVQAIAADKTIAVSGLVDYLITFNQANNTSACDAQKFVATCGMPTIFKDDKPLRQAVGLAVDKEAVNQQVVEGAGVVMNGPFPHNLAPWYDTSIAKFKRDVAAAKKLLDEDGWAPGADGIRAKNGKKLQWTLSTTIGNPLRAAQDVIVANLKDIGASVTVKYVSASVFFAGFHASGTLATGQFDMAMYGNIWSPDPSTWASFALSSEIPSDSNPGAGNYGRISDPKLDRLFQDGESTVDIARRVDIYKQVQAEWRDFGATVDLFEMPVISTRATHFGNYAPNGNLNGSIWNAADWFRRAG
ncbi:MAG: peptide ABC transporter substrate-binding protein [Chloroflexi bacterium]|nr:MAG: peptide ABC transporter substrate-binding protein [Chloroflexota bacterium]